MSSAPAERALREDAWLSEQLGTPAYRLVPGVGVGVGVGAGVAIAAIEGPAFVQATLPRDADDDLALLREAGLSVISEAVTFARRAPSSVRASEARVDVRAGDPGRDAVVGEIAERSFRYSRFHLDPEIENSVAARIKREWALNALAGRRGDQFLVAELGGEPVGFLAILDQEAKGERSRTVDLIGVDPNAQRSGAGAALMARMLADSAGLVVRAGTQTANEPAVRFYENLGFAVESAAHDLHLHLP